MKQNRSASLTLLTGSMGLSGLALNSFKKLAVFWLQDILSEFTPCIFMAMQGTHDEHLEVQDVWQTILRSLHRETSVSTQSNTFLGPSLRQVRLVGVWLNITA